jgi:hypothetical protein
MDDCGTSADSVVAGNGQFLHSRGIHPHSASPRDHSCADPADSRKGSRVNEACQALLTETP